MEYLIDFILGLSAGERGLYVIGFVFLGYKGIIKLPFIPIGKKKSKKHSECPLYPDMLKRGEIKAEIVEIEKRIQLRQQMNVIEASNIDIIYELQDTYTTICNSRADKKYYSKLIALVEKKCFEPMIRTWLKENHYTSQSEEKFTAYIVKKTGMLLGILKRELKVNIKSQITFLKRGVKFRIQQ